ncbi:MAG: MBL fold metallo-hydrolase [Candidatus Bathyarchaeota archaeon]|nr:MBL fold metallo-hydrolase [Candidatus Bathyarchaeota archaeon]
MTSLTFYGGIGEIGGNKILLEDQDTRIFLDFGMSFRQSGMFFSEFLNPRNCNGLGDYFKTGLLPDIPGVYRQDYLRHMGRPEEDQAVDAVLISHAHMDHMSYIHHLRKEVELVMSKGSHAILKTFQDTRSGGLNDLLIMAPAFQMRPSKRGGGYTRVSKKDRHDVRPTKVFEYGNKFKVGDIDVVAYEVDHSLPGAAAYLIHASEGSILYTGDFRFHGYLGDKTREMVEEVSKEDIAAVITEGTRVNQETGTSEAEVYTHAKKLTESTPGLVVTTFPARDLTRLSTFYRIACETGRKLVIDFTQAYLLEQFSSVSDRYPKSDDPNICLFAARKSWGIAGRDNVPSNIDGLCYPGNIRDQDYGTWEREYLHRENTVNFQDLQDQKEYLLVISYFQLNQLIDVKPVEGSKYLRSVTEPFSDEMRLDAERVQNWLDLFKLDLYGMESEDKLHASGHASGPELKDILHKIRPKNVIPIHTEHPELFHDFSHNIMLVERGETYQI